MQGPADLPFEVYGYVEFRVEIKGAFSSALFSCPGKMTLKMPDGSKFDITTKQIECTGLLSSEKGFNVIGQVNVSDNDNGVYAEVKFDTMKDKRTGYWTSFIKGSDKVNKDTGKLDNRSDLISISVTDDADCQISAGEGSYLEQVVFD